MKKLIFLLLLICFSLVGCGEQTEDSKTNTPEPKTQTGEVQETPVEDVYAPADTLVSFSDENMSKVVTEATFDVSQYTNKANTYQIKPYQYFSDGVCLQRDAVNRIWGKASKTSYIAAEINGKVYYGTVTGQDFEIYLPKMSAGGPYELVLISELGRLTIKNVYIGEVFLLSGQSNMEWSVSGCGNILKDLYETDECVNDQIRMLNVGWFPQEAPTTEVANGWKWNGANKETIPSFSAVGYLFGKKMQEELGCPVGLIWAAIGGSHVEFWLSEENYNRVAEIYTPYNTSDVYMTPCMGYNGMLYPLTGLNVRGVLWYQGESNAFGTQQYYDQALSIFIEQCREMFDNEQLTFTVCELARYEGLPYEYSIVNEKINKVAKEDPYVVVARNLDMGDWFDIHPKDKRELGNRAACETLRVFFKKDYEAPIEVSSYSFNNDGTVTITLSSEAVLRNGTNGFEVYVNGGYSRKCTVSIEGNVITISAKGVITKVRYGYTCEMTDEIKNDVSKMVTIYDKNGLPLDLFIITA